MGIGLGIATSKPISPAELVSWVADGRFGQQSQREHCFAFADFLLGLCGSGGQPPSSIRPRSGSVPQDGGPTEITGRSMVRIPALQSQIDLEPRATVRASGTWSERFKPVDYWIRRDQSHGDGLRWLGRFLSVSRCVLLETAAIPPVTIFPAEERFSPRLGFAIVGEQKTVIRGAWAYSSSQLRLFLAHPVTILSIWRPPSRLLIPANGVIARPKLQIAFVRGRCRRHPVIQGGG